jgi:hypothetical protein
MPGWEGSDEAFLMAKGIVLDVGRNLNIDWIESANSNYLAFVRAYQIKASDDDYQFIATKTEQLWDTFRNFMMTPEVSGNWNRTIEIKLSGKLSSIFRDAPARHKPEVLQAPELAILATDCLGKCLIEDKQLLSNAVFEAILVLWCHR